MNNEQNKLIEDNIAFARWLAHKWRKTQKLLSYDELESMAFFGLTKAAKTYKSEKGTQFNTYARFIIENEFRNAFKKEKKYTIKFGEDIEEMNLVNFDISDLIDLKTIINKYLTEEEREIIMAVYHQGMRRKEVAIDKGISISNVVTTIKEAKSKIEYLMKDKVSPIFL
ncbi:sigma-70 family RNA polymerase sigma factor [Clostridium chrysemydis]|uniref:sigma-70 family RNA polymerase sigma factor n=1 Tax=Clostridium chrysemydis TaxID=2665504 RepID=UPI0018841907|nr:sigma-70 family RNA polymerase sigma factor [Clostridium chrysemydis]